MDQVTEGSIGDQLYHTFLKLPDKSRLQIIGYEYVYTYIRKLGIPGKAIFIEGGTIHTIKFFPVGRAPTIIFNINVETGVLTNGYNKMKYRIDYKLGGEYSLIPIEG